jgi:hypothetical protein
MFKSILLFNNNKDYQLKSVEDGIVLTKEILPVGLGRLVNFYKDPELTPIPGIVMFSRGTTTVIFVLAHNYLVTIKHVIRLAKTTIGLANTKFSINIRISKLLGKTLDIFGNTFRGGYKKNFLSLPKVLGGISDRTSV